MKKIISVCVLCLIVVGSVFPNQQALAASNSDLESQLLQLKSLLVQMVNLLTIGHLPGGGQTVSGTTITVSTLKELITAMGAATGGETIRLRPGVYDFFKPTPYSITTNDPTISAVTPKNTSLVTITSDDPNNRAVLRGIEITVPYFAFVGLSFRVPKGKSAFTTYGAAHHLKMIGNDVASENAFDAKTWDKTTWLTKTAGNFMTNTGPTDSEIAYNNVRYMHFGIIAGAGTWVHDNKIQHISGDASRVWGPGTVVENNYFADNYLVDGNHNDFLQSWVISPAKFVGGVTVRNNSFIGLDAEAPQMAISSLADSQGIGLFDGPFQDWVVENNLVVVTRQWHGISMYGGVNSTIRRNVVADAIYSDTYGPAWLMLTDTKAGSSSINTSVTDNYSTSLSLKSAVATSGNIKILGTDYPKYFKDSAKYDWTIVPGSLPFSVGATIDKSKLAPEPYKDLVTPMDNSTVIPANNTVGGVVGGTSLPTPQPATAPTLTLAISAPSLTAGGTATLTWSTTNATTCTASGSWTGSKSTSGSESATALNVAGTQIYTLSCTGAGGSVNRSVTVAVTSAPGVTSTSTATTTDPTIPAPRITLALVPGEMSVGKSATLTWNTTNANSCTARGAWSGAKNLNGNESLGVINEPGTYSYSLRCLGNGGTSTRSISLKVMSTSTAASTTAERNRVVTTSIVNVRSAPYGTKIGLQPIGAQGTKRDVASIVKDGFSWIYVDFDTGPDGYVAQSYMASATTNWVMITQLQALLAQLLAQLKALRGY